MKARYIMVGGFLGAGKTTAVSRLAQHLASRGRRVGLITNDQGSGLVDTTLLRARGFATEEIAGGCFCCRFQSLMDAAGRLTAATRPDVILAEPVGSCTDLVATVTYPLRRIYGNDFSVAPLSVLIDPIRAARVLGLERGNPFSAKVVYIYQKQLEEADLLIINKSDLLAEEPRRALREALSGRYPRKEIFEVSARLGTGLDAWFARLEEAEQPAGMAIDLDYATYAEGEAELGWFNATIGVGAGDGVDANALLGVLAGRIQERLRQSGNEVAHLKMTLSPANGWSEVASIHLVRNDCVPELCERLEEPVATGELIINLRAAAPPSVLLETVEGALIEAAGAFPGLRLERDHLESFRPGKPVPTHRVPALGE